MTSVYGIYISLYFIVKNVWCLFLYIHTQVTSQQALVDRWQARLQRVVAVACALRILAETLAAG